MRRSINGKLHLYSVRFRLPGRRCCQYVDARNSSHAFTIIANMFPDSSDIMVERMAGTSRVVQTDRLSIRGVISNA